MSSDPQLGRDPGDEPPRWVRVWWPPIARLGLFAIGGIMALTGPTDVHVVSGSMLMLGAAGFAIAKWIGRM